jgi:hypothetical protein
VLTGIRRRVLGAAFAAALLTAPAAWAGFLGGSVEFLSVTRTPPSLAIADNSLKIATVGAQVEYDRFFDFIDVSDNAITLGNDTRNCGGGSCPVPSILLGDFFGFRLVDRLNAIPAILDVRIAASTIAGFSAGDIVFSENEIFLRIEKTGGYVPGNVIPTGLAVLNVTFDATPIPEPSGGALFAAGLAAIFLVRRRRIAPR